MQTLEEIDLPLHIALCDARSRAEEARAVARKYAERYADD